MGYCNPQYKSTMNLHYICKEDYCTNMCSHSIWALGCVVVTNQGRLFLPQNVTRSKQISLHCKAVVLLIQPRFEKFCLSRHIFSLQIDLHQTREEIVSIFYYTRMHHIKKVLLNIITIRMYFTQKSFKTRHNERGGLPLPEYRGPESSTRFFKYILILVIILFAISLARIFFVLRVCRLNCL